MTAILLLNWALMGAVPANATTSNGETVLGELTEWQATQIAVADGTTTRRIPFGELASLVILPSATSAEVEAPTATLELWDQTRLAGELLGCKEGQITFLFSGESINLQQTNVRSLRLRALGKADPSDAPWAAMNQTEEGKDRLIVRANSSLDAIEGVAGEINADRVVFAADDETLRVKRTKVEGITFAKPRETKFDPATCELRMASGTRIVISSAALQDRSLTIKTPSRALLTVPLRSELRFDFTSANSRYLSDLQPSQITQHASVESSLASVKTSLAPRRDQNRQGRSLTLDGKSFAHGWSLASSTEMEFRLPEGFPHFTALVGIDPAAQRGQGLAELKLFGDGKEIWTGKLSFQSPAQKIEVDMTGVKLLKMVVTDGDRREFGDWVNLCEAKLTK
jgi:hypothetical protein